MPPFNQLMSVVRRPAAYAPSNCCLAGLTSTEVTEMDFSSESKRGCCLPITVVTGMRRECKLKPINVISSGDRHLRPVHLSNIDTRMPVFLLSNVCHILNKTDELSVLFSQYAPSIVCLTETWLTPEIPDSVVDMQGYAILWKDRLSGLGGGVAVYISNDCQFHRFSSLECNLFEVLWLLVRPKQLPRPLSSLVVAVVYCPP